MVPAREVRFVLVVDEYEATARVFRDLLGLEVLMDLDGQGGRGVILRIPHATLELVDAEHERMVDDIEVGRSLGSRIRVAVRVDDLEEASGAVVEAGATPEGEAVVTPWGDRNRRLRTSDGLQLTLFQAP